MSASQRAVTKTGAATTFHDHLKELRTRLFVVVVIFITAATVAFSYKDWLLEVLMRPLNGEKLIYLTPAGGFSFIFQVSMYAGLIAAVPILIYNIFRFIAPVLSKRTRVGSLTVMLTSIVLLAMGVGFGYFYAIPAAMQFLIHFADGFVSASLTAEAYLGFVMAYTAGLGLLFQLPLIIMFVHWIKPLSPMGLLKFERYMILLAFVAAAIISPTPDALNQAILAAPIVIMYQLGVIGVWVSVRRKSKRGLAAAAKQARATKKHAKRQVGKRATPLAEVKLTGEAYASAVPQPKPKQPVVAASQKKTPRMADITSVTSAVQSRTPAVKQSAAVRTARMPIDGVVKYTPAVHAAPKIMSGVLPPAAGLQMVKPQARPGSYGSGSIEAPVSRTGRVIDGVAARPQRQASDVQIPPARRSTPARVVRTMQPPDRTQTFTEKGLDKFLF